MAATRLDSDERRQRIVDAAIPLFARKGFGGTTTRELAEAAGISEALLFRHFPSKELLYREILQQVGCQGDPVLDQLATLPAPTAALPGRHCVPYAGGPEALVEEASRFILRGIGMSDAAITAHTACTSGAGGFKMAAD